MIMYKGYKAVYLGLKRWKIFVHDTDMIFDVMVGSVGELIERIDMWAEIEKSATYQELMAYGLPNWYPRIINYVDTDIATLRHILEVSE